MRVVRVLGEGVLGALVPVGLLYEVPPLIHWLLFGLSLPGLGAWQLLYLAKGNTHGAGVIAMVVTNGAAYALIGLLVRRLRHRAHGYDASTNN